MRNILVLVLSVLFTFTTCTSDDMNLHNAFKAAEDNRSELKAVLRHYRTIDKDPEKFKAAKYIITNLPAHYSYADTAMVNRYYEVALQILKSGKDPTWQRDTLKMISNYEFPGMTSDVISDAQVISADFLINSIDHAFDQWRTRPWADHVTFEQFYDWLLPYKTVEYQQLDNWRDTLSSLFSEKLFSQSQTDEGYETAFRALDDVRNDMLDKVRPFGVYVGTGYPLLSASTMPRQTYGSCASYVTLGVSAYRSMGIPTIIDYTPCWGRYRAGHEWYVLLSDQGKELPSEWDISSVPGWGFFQYELIPKVYRNTFQINPQRLKYRKKAKYKYPFNLCEVDVTDHYMKTVDIDIPLKMNNSHGYHKKLKDKYCYIAVFNGREVDWQIIDYGFIKKKKAHFSKMGRNILYLVFGYDGSVLVPISEPFVLEKDGSLRFIETDSLSTKSIIVRRKYYQNENVVNMRRRLIGGKIQFADRPDFADAKTLFTITDTDISDIISLDSEYPHRYWRYLSPDGSFGSLAELAFFDCDTTNVQGTPISSTNDIEIVNRAFDGDWLSNFETDSVDGNWIGIDAGRNVYVDGVRIIPRSDDNDICPGNEYELFYWSGNDWRTLGIKTALGNTLEYDNVPERTLLWVRNYTRGWDERPFVIDDEGNIRWL